MGFENEQVLKMETKKTIDDRTPETDDAEWSMDSSDLSPNACETWLDCQARALNGAARAAIAKATGKGEA